MRVKFLSTMMKILRPSAMNSPMLNDQIADLKNNNYNLQRFAHSVSDTLEHWP